MLLPLATTVFWHPDPRNEFGPMVASSHVDLYPSDAAQAHADVLVGTGFPPARKMLTHTLRYDHQLPQDSVQALAAVDEMYRACTRCHLNSTRGQVVRWRGNPRSPVLFVGQGPGKEANELGQPLVGSPGKLHDEMCKVFGLDTHHDACFMDIIGCRPARPWDKDRDPSTAELLSCSERTMLYLRALRPRVVIALGKIACRLFFKPGEEPPAWSWTEFTPPGEPHNAVMFGHAMHPGYLATRIGGPKMYKEYAAARTYYTILKNQLPTLQKVDRWAFAPRYLVDFIHCRQSEPPWDTGVVNPDTVAHPVLRNLQEN